ncbi:MAG: hypothetical protein SV760_00090, partial [Halobacteria archaeon]|nr:hypothetical protein [Halobacteria archaeon]
MKRVAVLLVLLVALSGCLSGVSKQVFGGTQTSGNDDTKASVAPKQVDGGKERKRLAEVVRVIDVNTVRIEYVHDGDDATTETVRLAGVGKPRNPACPKTKEV